MCIFVSPPRATGPLESEKFAELQQSDPTQAGTMLGQKRAYEESEVIVEDDDVDLEDGQAPSGEAEGPAPTGQPQPKRVRRE